MWTLSVCLFVWGFFLFAWGFYVPYENFFTHMEAPPFPVKDFKFWPISAHMVIEQWGFFSVPQLLWHGASVYNDHLRELVTLTPVAEVLAVELSLPVLMMGLSRTGFKHPTFRMRGERSNRLRHRSVGNLVNKLLLIFPFTIFCFSFTMYLLFAMTIFYIMIMKDGRDERLVCNKQHWMMSSLKCKCSRSPKNSLLRW